MWAEREFLRHGWSRPRWLPTTASTRGRQETARALAAGTDVVVAAGGDGTVRAVAEELLGTGVPMALLPTGTGNLLARNVGVNPAAWGAAISVVCQGNDKAMDVGWLEVDRTGQGSYLERHPFMVMAGAGLDAATMQGASEKMKRRMGQAAYLYSGIRSLGRPMATTTVRVDGELVLTESSHGVILGNCGLLTRDVSLMPDADPHDEMLNAVVLLPRKLSHWARLAWAVRSGTHQSTPFMPALQGSRIEMRTDSPQPVQVDGDVIGHALGFRSGLYSATLLVRQPPTMPSEQPYRPAAPRTVREGLLQPV
ncbi:diacylglycerol kinase family protein [Arthrobacter sp. NQ7]|nr:diacylglycerol kinase family protein [Arthrobacter sp. NQ7]MDJ0458641.1 diacylglycerol kinase family protein [Arthrobacter sp. NQ7]